MHGEDDHTDRGVLLADLPGGADAVAPRHVDVHQHDVRHGLVDDVDGFLPVTGLADHVDAFGCVAEQDDAVTGHGMFVDDHDPGRCFFGHGGHAGLPRFGCSISRCIDLSVLGL